jgi:putative lipoic acid-binding regulatory protein
LSDIEGGRPAADEGLSEEDRREREIALIESCHRFPGAFSLSVIARNDPAVTDRVLAAIAAGTEHAPRKPLTHERRPSAGDKYVSHRIDVHCLDAADAHTLRARLRALPGVLTVL